MREYGRDFISLWPQRQKLDFFFAFQKVCTFCWQSGCTFWNAKNTLKIEKRFQIIQKSCLQYLGMKIANIPIASWTHDMDSWYSKTQMTGDRYTGDKSEHEGRIWNLFNINISAWLTSFIFWPHTKNEEIFNKTEQKWLPTLPPLLSSSFSSSSPILSIYIHIFLFLTHYLYIPWISSLEISS